MGVRVCMLVRLYVILRYLLEHAIQGIRINGKFIPRYKSVFDSISYSSYASFVLVFRVFCSMRTASICRKSSFFLSASLSPDSLRVVRWLCTTYYYVSNVYNIRGGKYCYNAYMAPTFVLLTFARCVSHFQICAFLVYIRFCRCPSAAISSLLGVACVWSGAVVFQCCRSH